MTLPSKGQQTVEECEHLVEWDYSDIYNDEDSISICGECKKCEVGFMATYREPLYSILNDKNEWDDFDDKVKWAN